MKDGGYSAEGRSVSRRTAPAVLITALLSQLTVFVGAAGAAPTAAPVVTGRNYPAMFTVASDGRIFYSELLTGRVGTIDPADGTDTTWAQVPDLCTESDQGLYGLAFPPGRGTGTLYAYATRRAADGSCQNQVLRMSHTTGGELSLTVLLAEPYVGAHNGGRIKFGPDGNLYVSTGDGAYGMPTLADADAQQAKAQDVQSLKGKVLRITTEGGLPAGNPFGNAVFAYGFRNVFGFDFDAATGQLWVTDNGPDPEYAGDPAGPGPRGGCNDELNLVVKGANYGWGPTGDCGPPGAPSNTNRDGPSPVLPKYLIEAATGITGAAFCQGCGLGAAYEGRLFYVRYDYANGLGEIHAATLSADRSSVVSDALVYRPPGPAPLSIERGPDGVLYFSDSESIHKLVDTSPIPPADFDGNRSTDYSVFRPSSGTWFAKDGLTTAWGTDGDVPVPADYNGDRTADVAVFRPSNGVWFVKDGTTLAYGTSGDVPVPADYDGDKKADIAVFRPSDGVWFIHYSSGGDAAFAWGTSGDVAVPADYDGDGKADAAVFRNGVWFIRPISGAADITVSYGTTGDVPVVSDYDADRTADMAVFRPSTGTWFLRHSSGNGEEAFAWGTSGDIPVPGDYNGDAISDPAVFRPSTGTWFVHTGAVASWGVGTDIPLPIPASVRITYFSG